MTALFDTLMEICLVSPLLHYVNFVDANQDQMLFVLVRANIVINMLLELM